MKARFIFVLLLILTTFTESHAFEGISLGMGRARGSIDIYHLGLQKQFNNQWLGSKVGYLSGYHEISLNCWKHEKESIKQAAYSPVFTYVFAGMIKSICPYLEGGIGIGLLSEKTISGRDLSTHFQFEDRIGLGLRIGRRYTHDLNIRYMHYSNASIKQPNDGIDIFIFSYTFSF
jgi:lipid A 3-O-deacylase